MDQIEQILDTLRGLLSAFPAGASGRDGDAALRGYMVALEGRRLVDVTEGCRRLIAGEVEEHDGRYAPTPPQLARAVRQAEGQRIESERRSNPPRSIAPPQMEHSPEERARVAAMAAALVAKVAAQNSVGDTDEAKARQRVWGPVHARFDPDMSPEAVRARLMPNTLGFDIGDHDGDRDVA